MHPTLKRINDHVKSSIIFKIKCFVTRYIQQNMEGKMYAITKYIRPKNVSNQKMYPTIKYIQQHNKSNHNKYPARKCILFSGKSFFRK